MPKLIYHTGACSLAPHVVLEWIGAPYEEQAVEFGDRDLLAANPAGAVPVLIEDDPALSGPQAPAGRSGGRRRCAGRGRT